MSPTAPGFLMSSTGGTKPQATSQTRVTNDPPQKTAAFSGKNMLSPEEQGLGGEGALALSHSPPLSSCVTSGKLFTLSQPQSIKWG